MRAANTTAGEHTVSFASDQQVQVNNSIVRTKWAEGRPARVYRFCDFCNGQCMTSFFYTNFCSVSITRGMSNGFFHTNLHGSSIDNSYDTTIIYRSNVGIGTSPSTNRRVGIGRAID